MFRRGYGILILMAAIAAVLLLSVPSILAETEHFEKGDLIFRKGFPLAGHTGIYYKWKEKTDPEKRISHRIIEAAGEGKTVWETTFAWFCNDGTYLGGGSLYPTAKQRQRIVDLAYNRRGYEYHFKRGYKDRQWGRTYRCDGLAEHCYEIALGNHGIVEDTNWRELTPKGQWRKMRPLRIEPPTIKKIDIKPSELIDGKYHINDNVKIECKEVSDGDWGSGVAQVEFWLGPTDRPLDESQDEKIGTDNHRVPIKGDYKYLWDTSTVESGEYKLYAKAFDQAGNTKETYINVKIEEPPYYFHVQLSPEYVKTGSPVSQTETFTITVQCYNYGDATETPAGTVNKLDGTQSWVKDDTGVWQKEEINTNQDISPAEAKSDYTGEVSFGIANITNSAYELYAGGEKLETLELIDGTGSISGVVIKAKDGDISNDRLFLIISVSDGTGSGNNALMINLLVPVYIYTDDTMVKVAGAGNYPTADEAWAVAMARWDLESWVPSHAFKFISFSNQIGRWVDPFPPYTVSYVALITARRAKLTVDLTAYDPENYLEANLVVKPTKFDDVYYNEQGWLEGEYNSLKDMMGELGNVWVSDEYYADSYTPSQPVATQGKGYETSFYIGLKPKMPE